jgi:hypothetical protein
MFELEGMTVLAVSERDGEQEYATQSGDFLLATNRDFLVAVDSALPYYQEMVHITAIMAVVWPVPAGIWHKTGLLSNVASQNPSTQSPNDAQRCPTILWRALNYPRERGSCHATQISRTTCTIRHCSISVMPWKLGTLIARLAISLAH